VPPPPLGWQNWLQRHPCELGRQTRMPKQFGSQQRLGQLVSALAALGVIPTPRHPASIDTATTSFTIFLRIAVPFKANGFPGLPISSRTQTRATGLAGS
jgi:hypothetical protein